MKVPVLFELEPIGVDGALEATVVPLLLLDGLHARRPW